MPSPLRRLGLSLMLTLGVVAWNQQPTHLASQAVSSGSKLDQFLPIPSSQSAVPNSWRSLSFSISQLTPAGQLERQLLAAVEQGDLEQVTTLLNRGANPNVGDRYDGYALTKAVQQGQTAIVEALLNHGASPNISLDEGYTPLVEALIAQNSTIVRRLLEHGANPNQVAAGMTPLSLAIGNDDAATVQLLLNHGADRQQTSQGKSPLELARQQGNAEILRLLRQ